MGLCGFNKKMFNALNDFSEALVEHGLEFRSKKNNESIEQAIRRELSDLSRLLNEIHRIDDSGKRLITEGIIKYAMGFYMTMRSVEIEKYKETVLAICNYFQYMDEKYYGELEGKGDDMKILAELLDKKEI